MIEKSENSGNSHIDSHITILTIKDLPILAEYNAKNGVKLINEREFKGDSFKENQINSLINMLIEHTQDKEINGFQDNDILVLSHTFVCKLFGYIIDISKIKPEIIAKNISNFYSKAMKNKGNIYSNLVQAILNNSESVIRAYPHIITQSKSGFICSNSGLDKSNIPGKNKYAYIPPEIHTDVNNIRNALEKCTGKKLAVIIADSQGRPFRIGTIGIAIAWSGLKPLSDYRHKKDLYGYEIKTKIANIADELCSAAQLAMGEANEQIPAVIIRGYNYDYEPVGEKPLESLLRKKNQDMFRSPDAITKKLTTLFPNYSSGSLTGFCSTPEESFKDYFNIKKLKPKYILLSGGVGGAKLVEGFYHLQTELNNYNSSNCNNNDNNRDNKNNNGNKNNNSNKNNNGNNNNNGSNYTNIRRDTLVIANIGDDIYRYGLRICPDIDIIVYTLAGMVNRQMGWGIKGDSYNVLNALKKFYGDNTDWFHLGDKDLATSIFRTNFLQNNNLSNDFSLSAVTLTILKKLGIDMPILPMAEGFHPTYVKLQRSNEIIHFEEYLVKRKAKDAIKNLIYSNTDSAVVPFRSDLENMFKNAEKIVIGPSNPFMSIGPIISIPFYRKMLTKYRQKVIAVSPLINNRALKGPLEQNLKDLGYSPGINGILECYKDMIGTLIVDKSDYKQLTNEINSEFNEYKDCYYLKNVRIISGEILLTSIKNKVELAKLIISLTT